MSLDQMLIILGLVIALPNAIQSVLDVLKWTEKEKAISNREPSNCLNEQ